MDSRPLGPRELAFLGEAAEYLEHPGLLVRAGALVGRPLEAVARLVPERQRRVVAAACEAGLSRALELAVRSLPEQAARPQSFEDAERAGRRERRRHRTAVLLSGAGGGLFGWAGLAVELPLTTSILLRSIAGVARDFGEDLADPRVRLECLTVFGHGGPGPAGDAVDSGYLATRIALARTVREAARFVACAGAAELPRLIARGRAPVLVRLLAAVAARFELVVSEKLLAQALPLAGAAGGALVNAGFAAHFDRVARFHFGIRRLERELGATLVRGAYRRCIEAVRGEVGSGSTARSARTTTRARLAAPGLG